VQTLRYTQTEAGLLPAWRVLSELRSLADMRAERFERPGEADDLFDGPEGVE